MPSLGALIFRQFVGGGLLCFREDLGRDLVGRDRTHNPSGTTK